VPLLLLLLLLLCCTDRYLPPEPKRRSTQSACSSRSNSQNPSRVNSARARTPTGGSSTLPSRPLSGSSATHGAGATSSNSSRPAVSGFKNYNPGYEVQRNSGSYYATQRRPSGGPSSSSVGVGAKYGKPTAAAGVAAGGGSHRSSSDQSPRGMYAAPAAAAGGGSGMGGYKLGLQKGAVLGGGGVGVGGGPYTATATTFIPNTLTSSSSSGRHVYNSRDMHVGGLPLLDVGSSAAAAVGGSQRSSRPWSGTKGGAAVGGEMASSLGEVPGSPLDDLLTRVTDLIQEFDTALGRR
jgi:hypothetical protein